MNNDMLQRQTRGWLFDWDSDMEKPGLTLNLPNDITGGNW